MPVPWGEVTKAAWGIQPISRWWRWLWRLTDILMHTVIFHLSIYATPLLLDTSQDLPVTKKKLELGPEVFHGKSPSRSVQISLLCPLSSQSEPCIPWGRSQTLEGVPSVGDVSCRKTRHRASVTEKLGIKPRYTNVLLKGRHSLLQRWMHGGHFHQTCIPHTFFVQFI